jgi:SAP domain-containing new25
MSNVRPLKNSLVMQRPALNCQTNAQEFLRWYWLKEELIAFCRFARIPASGPKPELTVRIAAHLAGQALSTSPRPSRNAQMPTEFTLETTIGQGWRCSLPLGVFLRAHCGRTFRFNAAVRKFVHTQVGRSLAEAVECYRLSVAPDSPQTEIAPQLEYNRHTREFYANNPGASRQQVLEAWWARRSRRAG